MTEHEAIEKIRETIRENYPYFADESYAIRIARDTINVIRKLDNNNETI